MTVLFHENQLNLRGTSVALYDYAHYNETILGNISYIAAPRNSDLSALEKFVNRFGDRVLLYTDFNTLVLDINKITNIDTAYFIKYGINDGLLFPGVKNIVHYVFDGSQPHGDHYLGVSEWLSEKYNTDYLPHIVSMPDINYSYRDFLNIPKDSIVFGRYGGADQFDVGYLREAIEAAANLGVYFLFMNTNVFTKIHSNILYVNPTHDVESKAAFINTCDAMIHGRVEGETFGLSICEFLYYDKPIVTNIEGKDKNHVRLLKDKGYYYSSVNELYSILVNFKKGGFDGRSLVKKYESTHVMNKFKLLVNG
jgi:hypothetical protein